MSIDTVSSKEDKNMKLAIFGATGKIGRHLVDQALTQWHQVTAFTRSPDKLDHPDENLTLFEGDVLESTSVKHAVQGQDGVLCALGMPLMNSQGLRTRGTKNIIRAMEETGVKRLICLSGLGAGDSQQLLPFHYRHFLAPLIMCHLYADHEGQESHVRNSPLDWVIVRPASFVKGPRTGVYQHGFTAADPSLKFKISHADVAEFMVKQLADDRYLRQSPSLSY